MEEPEYTNEKMEAMKFSDNAQSSCSSDDNLK